MADTLLQLKNASVSYGGVSALNAVSINIREGEITALMGPNGAGKSTALKAIFGLVPLDFGELVVGAEAVRPVPHKMVRRGISFVPQGRRVFSHLTVYENLEVGGLALGDSALAKKRVDEVLSFFPSLGEKINLKSGALSGGEQQMLALARGLMMKPKVLLLDEPSLGLAPKIVKEVFRKVKEVNEERGTSIAVVEHNIKSLFEILDTAYVLDKGTIAAEGPANDVLKSGILEKVFLGNK
jgi:branched-chain amino acid transport system ATP-binding protein